jgi:arabinofuranosyltransferase
LETGQEPQLAEAFSVYGQALGNAAVFVAAWSVVFLALSSARARQAWAALSERSRRWLMAGLVAAAFAWAWHLISLFDDAYISLRYARNFARGNGLVWNLGERVEGYTNFLWTLMLGIGIAAGLDGPHLALVGCLAAFVAELLLVARISRLLANDGEKPVLPIAALLLGAGYTFATYGTSGMETMFTTLLVTLALERALRGDPGWSGLCGILAVMNHPDAAVLYVGLGATLSLDPQTRRALPRYGAPFLLLYVPYFLWRWHYYGDLLPNTYYAKSGGMTYFSQGIFYVVLSAFGSGMAALLPLGVWAMWRRPRQLLTRFALLGVLPYLFYVAKVGGDFMLGRLLVPVLPFVALLAEQGFRDVWSTGVDWARVGAVVLLGIAASPLHLIGEKDAVQFITDERTFYHVHSFWPRIEQDELSRPLSRLLDGIVARGAHPVVSVGAIGVVGYDTELTVVDWLGLTDRTVAHQELTERGRPGHEKTATPEYLRSRNVMIATRDLYPPGYGRFTTIRLGTDTYQLGKYEPQLVGILRLIPGVRVPNVPHILDRYIAEAMLASPPTLARDVAFFDEYYFSVNDDPQRREQLHALLDRQAMR